MFGIRRLISTRKPPRDKEVEHLEDEPDGQHEHPGRFLLGPFAPRSSRSRSRSGSRSSSRSRSRSRSHSQSTTHTSHRESSRIDQDRRHASLPQHDKAKMSSPLSDRSRPWGSNSCAHEASPCSISRVSEVAGSIFVPRPDIRLSNPLPPFPPLPHLTQHSSTSCLCSCDCHADLPEQSASAAAAGSVAVAKTNKSPRLCLFPDDPKHQRPLSSSALRHVQGTPPTRPSTSHELNEEAQTSTTSLLEALSLAPGFIPGQSSNKPYPSLSRPKTAETSSTDDKSVGAWSDNVQQLIRETDEAFKAVGCALAEAKLASQSFDEPFPSEVHRKPPPIPVVSYTNQHSSLPPLPPPPPHPPHPPPAPPRLSPRVHVHHTFPKRAHSRHAPIPGGLTSPTRVKRKTPTKAAAKSGVATKRPSPLEDLTKRKSSHPLSSASSSKHSRWTLTENVADLLNAAGSKLFNRIEAVEMLTPQQIQELKRSRQQRLSQEEEEANGHDRSNTATDSSEGTDRSSYQSDSSSSTTPPATTTPTLTPIATRLVPSTAKEVATTDETTVEDSRRESIASITSINTVTSSTSSYSNHNLDHTNPSPNDNAPDNETPTDAFHLSDLPSRIRASEVSNLPDLVRIITPSPPSPFCVTFKPFGVVEDGDIIRDDFSVPAKKRPSPLDLKKKARIDDDRNLDAEDQQTTPRKLSGLGVTDAEDRERMVYGALSFPSPPPISGPGSTRNTPTRKQPSLPTIPEVTITSVLSVEEGIQEMVALLATPVPDASVDVSTSSFVAEKVHQKQHRKQHEKVVEEVKGKVATKATTTPTTTATAASAKEPLKWRPHPTLSSTYLYLPSPPRSNLHPFHQGPIRFNRTELKRNLQLHAISNRSSLQEAEPMFSEGPINWTAFQVALMGGAGDVFWRAGAEDDEEKIERVEREEVEDSVFEWWAGLNGGVGGGGMTMGLGRLVSEEEETEMEFLKWAAYDEDEGEEFVAEEEYSPVSLGETPDLPPPTTTGPNSGNAGVAAKEMQEKVRVQTSPFLPMPSTPSMKSTSTTFGPEKYFAGPGMGLRKWSGGQTDTTVPTPTPPDGGDVSPSGQRRNILVPALPSSSRQRRRKMSEDTLPPSPMMTITVGEGEDGEAQVGVPMGYNLGHDLGDFLKWEAEHAFAGGYHGPDN